MKRVSRVDVVVGALLIAMLIAGAIILWRNT